MCIYSLLIRFLICMSWKHEEYYFKCICWKIFKILLHSRKHGKIKNKLSSPNLFITPLCNLHVTKIINKTQMADSNGIISCQSTACEKINLFMRPVCVQETRWLVPPFADAWNIKAAMSRTYTGVGFAPAPNSVKNSWIHAYVDRYDTRARYDSRDECVIKQQEYVISSDTISFALAHFYINHISHT